MAKDLSEIKLSVGNNLKLNLEDKKIGKLLIAGNTINFFGFVKDGNLDFMSMGDEDRKRYLWLLKRAIEKTEIYVIGEIEEKEHYIELFDVMGQQGIRVNWKYMETVVPKDYLNIIEKIKNMKFDICVMNPPYGNAASGESPHLHFEFVRKINEISDINIVVMPHRIMSSSSDKYNKWKTIFDKTLMAVYEITGDSFEGTSMANVGIFEFNNNKKDTDIIRSCTIDGSIQMLNSLFDCLPFNNYELCIFNYVKNDKFHINVFRPLGLDKKQNLDQFIDKFNKGLDNKDKSYLLTNLANGGMNGSYMSSKVGQIVSSQEDLKQILLNRKGSCCAIISGKNDLCLSNLKNAMQRSLLRFMLYRLQDDQNMRQRVYVGVPAIDWEDPRCLTDEGILEMCGCPSDKAKEYAQYCKEVIDKVDKKI